MELSTSTFNVEGSKSKPIRPAPPRPPRENSGFGVSGVWGAIFTRVAQKLRRLILLHFGLIVFRIHFGKTRKPFIFMIFRFLGVSMTPKTNYS